ncbi:MAG: hypothetical protein JXR68_10540 [Bacteroidales bacterium]|nr:hypothetical protein [Bacteroidales bacterium]
MKHVILLVTFFLLFYSGFSQSRIGWTELQIKTEFYSWSFDTDYLNDGTKYIVTDDENNATIAYFFNEQGLCYLTMVMPSNQVAVNYYVQTYNNQYVIVSDTEWKAYLANGVLVIKLFFGDDGPYFIIQ